MIEELIFRTKVETGKSKSETEKLTKSLDELNDSVKDVGTKGADSLSKLNKRVEEGNFTMREAAKIVKEYGAIALQAGRTSPVGQEAIRMAGELTDTLGDLRTEIVNAGTDGANLKAGLELAGTVTAGYGALQGVIALTGSENEALAETFVKLQSVQSVLTGIEQIRASLEKESLLMTKAKVIWTKLATSAEYVYAIAVGTTTGAMKALRIAMLAIPIIAIIAAVVALIAILASFFEEEKKAEEQNKKLNESFESQNKALEANTRAFKRNADNKRALMVSENATAQELFEFDKERLSGEEVLRKKNLKMLKEILPQKNAAYKQALKEENWELAKTIGQETKQMREKYRDFKELDGQYANDKKLLENNYRNELAKEAEDDRKEQEQKNKEYAKRAQDRRQVEAQRQLDHQKLLEDLIVTNIKDADDRKLAQLKLAQSREMSEVSKKYGDKSNVVKELERKQLNELYAQLDEFQKARDDSNKVEEDKNKLDAVTKAEAERKSDKARLEGKLIALREDFALTQEVKSDLALLEMQEALSQKDITEGEKYKIEQEYVQKIDALKDEKAEKDKERQKQVAEASTKVTQMGLDSAQGLADAFFDYRISKAEKGSAEELKLEKKKFEINKKLQIAQAIMQGTQATLAAFSSGAAIPIVGPIAGPAFAAVAGVTSALNVAKIRSTTFDSAGGTTSTPSVSAPSISVPDIQGQNSSTSTLTQGLQGSQQSSKVYIVDSELKASLGENQQVSIVSNIG
jgi:hypothetical protein